MVDSAVNLTSDVYEMPEYTDETTPANLAKANTGVRHTTRIKTNRFNVTPPDS